MLNVKKVEDIGSSVPEIFEVARKNMVDKQKVKIVSMENALASILGGEDEDDNDIPEKECFMAVMTNQDKLYGANAFLRKDLLKKYADKIGKDLYIIPSSIHELLILPKCDSIETRELRKMVYEVNTNAVTDEEILSYNVYEYDRKKNQIVVAK